MKPKNQQWNQCRILQPGETIVFGNRELTNIGEHPTTACEIMEGVDEHEVLDKLSDEFWYPEYDKFRNDIINQCLLAGNLSQKKCQSRPYIKEQLLVGTESDPFDTQKATHIKTRYISSLIKRLYPPTKDKDGSFTNQFHSRNVHYRFLSENIAIPIYDKKLGWQLGKYKGEKKDWDNLKEALVEGRNAGLIPQGQMVDRRVLFEMKPPQYRVGKAKDDEFQPKVELNIDLNKDFDIDVDVPQVLFYSEKSEMGYVLETLAKKYNLAYFLGRGHISTSNAHRLYEFIKEHGDNAVVLTLCDYDESGLNIAQSLARKLQFYRQSDKSEKTPNIIVHQFAISPKDAKELERKGVEMGIKRYKQKDDKVAKKIYELAALEVFARDQGISLADYFELELLKLLKHDPECLECSTLISHKQIQERIKAERKRLEKDIQLKLQQTLNQLPNRQQILQELNIIPNVDGSINILKYVDQVKELFERTTSYTTLETAVQQVKFTPKDIVQKKFQFSKPKLVKNESLLWWKENPNYQLATQRLNRYKEETKDIIEYADPEKQKEKEQQQQMDLMESERESDEELAARILNILDPNDRVESYHALVAVLNNDPDNPSNYYVGTGGQFWNVMQKLKHEGKVTYLPVEVEERKIGWYKGSIDIPIREPLIKRPKFESRTERTRWELEQYGTKKKAKAENTKEAIRLFQSKNPATGKFWTLDEIGKTLGYSTTPVYTWLNKAGINTKSVRKVK